MNADILQHIIFEAINLLTEKGAEVHAVIFDGAPKNISMENKLGCNIEKLDGTFDHPSKPGNTSDHTSGTNIIKGRRKMLSFFKVFHQLALLFLQCPLYR